MGRKLRLTGVAVRHEGRVVSLPEPARHCDVLRTLGTKWVGDLHMDQGFVDEDGNYLHRRVALARAYSTGQVAPDFKPRAGILFSEDLW